MSDVYDADGAGLLPTSSWVDPAPAPPNFAISAIGLNKWFDGHHAVNNVSLHVPHGSFCGLVGPNGAGKSTSMSMMTGLLRPDSGHTVIGVDDVWSDPVAVKQRIGVLPETLRLFERLSGTELLHYIGELRHMPTEVVEQRSAELLRVFELEEAGTKLITDFSTGMRKKIGLAAAMLHSPAVLFLDEPFESVDPVSVRTIRNVLERFTASGGTILFSSHVMAVVEELCDRVAIMNGGVVVASGPTDEIRNGRRLEAAFIELVGGGGDSEEALAWLRPLRD